MVGVVLLPPHPVDSRLRGNDGPCGWCCLVVCPAEWMSTQVHPNLKLRAAQSATWHVS